DYLDCQPALLRGYHRTFCVYSVHYRGTEKKPGVVLGLDRGGSCRGRAYRIAANAGKAVLNYLHEREMITGVYKPRWVKVAVPGRRVTAATYLVDHGHGQYTGKLSDRAAARLIRQGHGRSGSNLEYLENTVRHLDELGIADCPMHRLLRHIHGQRR
ncbi:MAG: gamma-glutamylcyclotransferase, partial [Dongiaceae bacterium]